MQGSAIVKNYKSIIKKGFYMKKDFDPKHGGDFYFLIEPLNGTQNEKFFYVKELVDGSFEIEGEAHVVQIKDAKAYRAEAIEAAEDVTEIALYFLNEAGDIIKRKKLSRSS